MERVSPEQIHPMQQQQQQQQQLIGQRQRRCVPNIEMPINATKPKGLNNKLGYQQDTSLTKVFVGGLAWETTSESLQNHFSAYGDIVEAAVIVDRQNGRSKGYGFVTYKDEAAAERAIQEPNPVIDDRKTNCVLAAEGARKRFTNGSGNDAWMKGIINGTMPAGGSGGGPVTSGAGASTASCSGSSIPNGGPGPWGYYVVYGQPPFHSTEYGFQPVMYIPPGPMPPTSVYGAYIPASFHIPTDIPPDLVVVDQQDQPYDTSNLQPDI